MKLSFTTAELNHLIQALNREEYYVKDEPEEGYLTEDDHAKLLEYLESARESEWPVYDVPPPEEDYDLNPKQGYISEDRFEYLIHMTVSTKTHKKTYKVYSVRPNRIFLISDKLYSNIIAYFTARKNWR